MRRLARRALIVLLYSGARSAVGGALLGVVPNIGCDVPPTVHFALGVVELLLALALLGVLNPTTLIRPAQSTP